MPEDDSFAALFEAQPKGQGKPQKNFRIGDTIEAIVVRVGKDTIFLEIDGKRQAMLDTIEMQGPDGSIDVKEGDTLRAKVVEVDEASGSVRLGRSLGKSGDPTQIQTAYDAGIAIEGKVTGVNKGGIEVDLGRGSRGFCPMSQISAHRMAQDEVKDLIGQSFSFMVTEIKDGGRSIVLSRRRVLESEAQRGREEILSKLEKGQLVRGTVTAVRDFGAFVDLGGIDGLIPASELAHAHVTAGETIEALVLEIKNDEKGQTRITLSLKALMPAPERVVRTVGSKLSIGAIVRGKVVRIESYGVFLQVDGMEGREGRGLVPAAELGVARGVDLRKTFPEGTELTAKVLETGDGRLKLSVKGAKDDAERAEFESHKDQTAAGSFGTFADLLKKKT